MNLTCSFKKKHSLEKRKAESKRILAKYADKIPIIVSRDEKSKSVEKIDKCKYLAPDDITLAQFAVIIRKRIELSETEAFFFFTSNNTMPASTSSLRELYSSNKDEDGFLYLYYCGENVFGTN
jgi:GABA(A) receptor-associated protein